MDYYKEGDLVPLIKFNIYNPITKEKLNITLCNNVYIKIKTKELQNFDIVEYSNLISKFNNDENETNINNKDNILINIQEQIIKGNLNNTIKSILDNKEDVLIEAKDTIFQLTSPENQKNNLNNNISTINLKDCEKKLKIENIINNNESLLIFKIDYFEEGSLIPIIQYQIYDSKEKKKLNLSICQNEKIDLSIPVLINENILFKYNLSNEYYEDVCYPYTSDKGTDIILNDRKNEFMKNNMSLCENKCKFQEYNYKSKRALCECEVKINLPLISEIIINKDKLIDNFIDLKKSSNIYILKCLYYSNYFFYKYNFFNYFYNKRI